MHHLWEVIKVSKWDNNQPTQPSLSQPTVLRNHFTTQGIVSTPEATTLGPPPTSNPLGNGNYQILYLDFVDVNLTS